MPGKRGRPFGSLSMPDESTLLKTSEEVILELVVGKALRGSIPAARVALDYFRRVPKPISSRKKRVAP